ncbi:hypothetical protein EYR40_004494 [Pleurotus pulmonarius]|nr:hypothetical protein EYR40_004494 [Pleurotus pulmonarius]KAF4607193.1 hypothetical protein EYR38_001253 [Pleurotus pulmonarius]
MGNDGGSIPDRRDLVRTKPKAEQADKANQTRARWFFCALSKRRLQEPVVSCALGKLYNKDALLEYLLDRSAFGDGDTICGHIRSLKDVKTLTLTPNPARDEPERPQFICPLSHKEMNGGQPFVYISACGCVFSQAGLKTVSSTSNTDTLDVCPQCATKFDRSKDVVVINPSAEEEECMRMAMEEKRLAEPVKKSKKRKAKDEATADRDEGAKKKKTSAPSLNPSIAAASRAVVKSLAQEESKRKAEMSDAVKSLYGDGLPKKKETFMTMGTFTRVSCSR